MSGVDPEIEEGWGGIHIEWGLVRAVVCVCIVHSVLRGSGGRLPQENLDLMRVLLRPSETTITMQNLCQLECNSGDSSVVVSRSPFPPESAFVFVALPQNCLLGAADLSALCLQNMLAVLHIELCAASE